MSCKKKLYKYECAQEEALEAMKKLLNSDIMGEVPKSNQCDNIRPGTIMKH